MHDSATSDPAISIPTEAEVVEWIRRHAPSFWRDRPLPPELRLDDAGIGFDSVALLELLVACERELGFALPTDFLLEDEMTVGGLTEKLRRAAVARRT